MDIYHIKAGLIMETFIAAESEEHAREKMSNVTKYPQWYGKHFTAEKVKITGYKITVESNKKPLDSNVAKLRALKEQTVTSE